MSGASAHAPPRPPTLLLRVLVQPSPPPTFYNGLFITPSTHTPLPPPPLSEPPTSAPAGPR
eukprot:1919873-Rhodomonas_salina.1